MKIPLQLIAGLLIVGLSQSNRAAPPVEHIQSVNPSFLSRSGQPMNFAHSRIDALDQLVRRQPVSTVAQRQLQPALLAATFCLHIVQCLRVSYTFLDTHFLCLSGHY